MAERIKIGVTDKTGKISLDKLMGGGVPKSNVVLVTGAPGTCKSILCYHLAAGNAASGKKCLYVAFDQIKDEILEQAKMFGLNLKHKNILLLTYERLDDLIVDALIDQLGKSKFDIVILDSIASISAFIPEEEFAKLGQGKIVDSYVPIPKSENSVVRAAVRRLLMAFKKKKTTAFLVNELPGESKELEQDSSAFLADGIIAMYRLGVGSQEFRSMQVVKMRRTNHEKDYILFDVGKKGLSIKERKPV